MINRVSSFVKNVSGSKSKIFDITSKLSPSGDFERISDIEVILSSWNIILKTPIGTYDHDPDFGSNLVNYIFEPADKTTADLIKTEISNVLSRYDNRATLSNIDVQFLLDKKGFVISLDVMYKGNKEKLKIIINENIYFNFLRQT